MAKSLLYTIDYPPNRGGVARYLFAVASYFGEEMDVIVPAGHPRWWTAAVDLFRRARRYRTVVVSHVLPLGTAAMVACFLARRQYVVIVHGMDLGLASSRPLRRAMASLVLRRAVAVVANSRALADEARRDFGARRVLVAYPVLALPSATVAPRVVADGGTIQLLTVARLVPRKGHLRVLDAIALLRRERPNLRVRYAIVGDGPARASVEDAIRSLGLSGAVTIEPDASDADVVARYAAADAFVMPVVRDAEDREGFGTVFLEAASFGVPSISTDMPGVDEAVLKGQTGILVPDGDVRALMEAIASLADDPARRARLGSEARRRVLAEFLPDVQFAPLRAIL